MIIERSGGKGRWNGGNGAATDWRAEITGSLGATREYVGRRRDGSTFPMELSVSAVPLEKYGDDALKARFLPHLLRRDEAVWQGATWMTEVKGGMVMIN